MRKLVITILIVIIQVFTTNAQANNRNKFWGEIEVGYGRCFASLSDNYGLCEPTDNGLFSLQIGLGYYFTKQISLGISTGIVGYLNPGLNYLPLYFDFRCKPFENDILIDFKIGTQIKINEEAFKRGLSSELLLGYPIFKNNKFELTPCIGYSYTNYSVLDINKIDRKGERHGVTFKMKIVI